MTVTATRTVMRVVVLVGASILLLAHPVPAQETELGKTSKQAGTSPVKVFILAGQSNMEGCGAVHAVGEDRNERKGTLAYLVNDPVKAPTFKHLLDAEKRTPDAQGLSVEATNDNFGDPAPNRVKKLRVEYTRDGKKHTRTVNEGEELTIPAISGPLIIEKALYGDLPDGAMSDVTEMVKEIAKSGGIGGRWRVRDDVWIWFNGRRGGLSVGFGANKNLFGPELQFGHLMGDSFSSQVLIIKTAWGGQSLYKDFRPPSSGVEVGPRYTEMLETIKKVLANLKSEFPGYDGGGFELAGFVWWHGWNDGCDPKNAVPEYEKNLVNLIQDLRKDLKVPKLPVVIGELTGPWVEVGGEWGALRRAQAAAAAHPEFAGTVAFVETHDFVRKEEESPGGWPCHEFNNAETYFLVGNALGERMVRLLNEQRPEREPDRPKPTAQGP